MRRISTALFELASSNRKHCLSIVESDPRQLTPPAAERKSVACYLCIRIWDPGPPYLSLVRMPRYRRDYAREKRAASVSAVRRGHGLTSPLVQRALRNAAAARYGHQHGAHRVISDPGVPDLPA